jgi:3-oxoacyl-[acyl-carrier-protein] synthase-3
LRKINIIGTGKFLPSREISSEYLDEFRNKAKGYSFKKSQIEKRFFCNEETTSDLAYYSALSAIETAEKNYNFKREDIDLIISASAVPDQAIPCMAVKIHKRLGFNSKAIPAFDINSTCLSFLTSLDHCSYFLTAGRYKNILIVASDRASVGLDWDDDETCLIFGDGSAAVIVSNEYGNQSTILSSNMKTYSEGHDYCQVLGGGTSKHPRLDFENVIKNNLFQMNGKKTYFFSTLHIKKFINELLEQAGLRKKDIDIVIPHQASKLALHYLKNKLDFDQSKIIDIYADHGNQVAASIPTAFHEAIVQNRLQKGMKALIIGSSAGISFGGMVLEY